MLRIAFDDEDVAGIAPQTTPIVITANDLVDSDRTFHMYVQNANGIFDKIANIVGFSLKETKLAAVSEAKAFTVRTDSARPGLEQVYGSSVRLLVAASGWSGKVTGTLPMVAASVELGFRNASVGIQIRGFDESGLSIPDPSTFDVDSYAQWMASFHMVSESVMTDKSTQRPVFLEERPRGQGDQQAAAAAS